MHRGTPYVVCDVDGRPVSSEEAKAIIAERFTVSEEVRRLRRSKKRAGKAPQEVRWGHHRSVARDADARGDLPRTTTPARPAEPVKRSA